MACAHPNIPLRRLLACLLASHHHFTTPYQSSLTTTTSSHITSPIPPPSPPPSLIACYHHSPLSVVDHLHLHHHHLSLMPPRRGKKPATKAASPPRSTRIHKRGPSNADETTSKPNAKKACGDDEVITTNSNRIVPPMPVDLTILLPRTQVVDLVPLRAPPVAYVVTGTRGRVANNAVGVPSFTPPSTLNATVSPSSSD
ncbi:hypothetical protein BYT27DRAFT_7255052 [Phlegmacium glaucopus]|nr:hypothetical protein BYT27DRAFT_7255052 [Phlegmacium glaucopus]